MHIQFGRYWHLMVAYLKPQRLSVALLAILFLGNIVLQLLNPQIVRYFIDTAQSSNPLSALLVAAGLFLAIGVLQRAVAFASTYTAANVGWVATNALRADLALHCLHLDISFHKIYTPGELIERIDSDVTTLANFFSQCIIQVLGNMLLIAGVLVLLWRADWRTGVVLTLYSILTFVILRLLQNTAVKEWTSERESKATFYSFLEEHLTGMEDLRSAGAESYVTRLLFSHMRRRLETYRRARLMSNLTAFSTKFLYAIGYTLGLALGAFLYSQRQISLGTAYLFVYYIGMLSIPLETIKQQITDLQQASASIKRVEALFQIQPLLQEPGFARLPGDALAVAFHSVTFSYDGQENVLHDLSFQLQPGKILGLLGRTGSGKTTLARLLFRLYDPSSGSISLAGQDLCEVVLDDLRTHVGMVTQDVQLFHASIRDNLTFFNTRLSDEQIEQALKALDLLPWLQSLPQGLDTHLGADGQGFSAGEAQLLAFARVFLKDPGLVILDEASSRLDPATEELLERAVDRLLADRTGIVIAHRLQTVQRADDIMILEEGRIVEYGSRLALANDPNSHFYSLLQTGLEEVLA